MPVRSYLRLARTRQEIKPMSQRRNLIFDPRRCCMVEQGRKAGKRSGRGYIVDRFSTSDPGFQVNCFIHSM
jgi:hypothetical protein